jgi:hypothetical protein
METLRRSGSGNALSLFLATLCKMKLFSSEKRYKTILCALSDALLVLRGMVWSYLNSGVIRLYRSRTVFCRLLLIVSLPPYQVSLDDGSYRNCSVVGPLGDVMISSNTSSRACDSKSWPLRCLHSCVFVDGNCMLLKRWNIDGDRPLYVARILSR